MDCKGCPRNGTKCKGNNRLIVGCVQCVEARENAIKQASKPKRTFPNPKEAIPSVS